MNKIEVNKTAAQIVGNAAFSKLDCGGQGELVYHVASSYEIWFNATGCRQSDPQWAKDVLAALKTLGFTL